MSWKSRRRKAFFRHVELLKELPIYLIGQHVVIDESGLFYKKNKIHVDYKAEKESRYKKYLLDGKIKSPFDFDNYFNPDLTLDLNFEKNIRKRNTLTKIGQRWNDRIKNQFPSQDYTVVLYFNDEDTEWYLDFYNGSVNIEEIDRSKQCKDIVYLSK